MFSNERKVLNVVDWTRLKSMLKRKFFSLSFNIDTRNRSAMSSIRWNDQKKKISFPIRRIFSPFFTCSTFYLFLFVNRSYFQRKIMVNTIVTFGNNPIRSRSPNLSNSIAQNDSIQSNSSSRFRWFYLLFTLLSILIVFLPTIFLIKRDPNDFIYHLLFIVHLIFLLIFFIVTTIDQTFASGISTIVTLILLATYKTIHYLIRYRFCHVRYRNDFVLSTVRLILIETLFQTNFIHLDSIDFHFRLRRRFNDFDAFSHSKKTSSKSVKRKISHWTQMIFFYSVRRHRWKINKNIFSIRFSRWIFC